MSIRSEDHYDSTSSIRTQPTPHIRSPTTSTMLAATANNLHTTFANPARRSISTPYSTSHPGAGSSSSIPARHTFMEVHVSDGAYEASKVYAYVYLVKAVHSPQLLVHQAMEQVCSAPPFRLLPWH